MRVATVCRSNMNRSMEAHKLLKSKFRNVHSFGTARRCKLPGPTAMEPVIRDFGVPYMEIYKDLEQQDNRLFSRNGVLPMLERNGQIKLAPERWQNHVGRFDVIFTFERRVFNDVLEELHKRAESMDGGGEPVQIINIEVCSATPSKSLSYLFEASSFHQTRDKQEEAVTGAQIAFDLCELVSCRPLPCDAALLCIIHRHDQNTLIYPP